MKVLRRLPRLEAPLRDGRLCLSTAALLGPLLTEGNVDELVARAAFKTRAEVDELVAMLQPRAAPKDGIRKIAQPAEAQRETAEAGARAPAMLPLETPSPLPPRAGGEGEGEGGTSAMPAAIAPPLPPRADFVRAVSKDRWSLRVALDRGLNEDLESLKNLLGHNIPNGDLAAVLHEAVRCGIEKHGKRRGAVRPARTRKQDPNSRNEDPRAIPAELRRKVWERDGGCCTWVGEDGLRCGSAFQVEIDHVATVMYGGKPGLDDLRLLCRPHNFRYAEQVYGKEHMAQFRRRTRTGDFTIASDSAPAVKSASDKS